MKWMGITRFDFMHLREMSQRLGTTNAWESQVVEQWEAELRQINPKHKRLNEHEVRDLITMLKRVTASIEENAYYHGRMGEDIGAATPTIDWEEREREFTNRYAGEACGNRPTP